MVNNIMVMYHYVRDNTSFNAFSTKEFRDQIKYLQTKYKIISIQELINTKPTENTCVLTFDDGIKDCITNALPILKELGAKATFFISTKTLTEKSLLPTQKRHILLAKLGTEAFVKEFNEIADEVFHITKDGAKNCYDDELTSNAKYVLDYMDQKKAKIILDQIFQNHFNEQEEFDKMYLSKEDILELKKQGMEIGSHGHGHLRLGNLYYQDMEKDLIKSLEIFQNNLNFHPNIISYPFGNYSIFTKRLAKKLGFQAGITIKKEFNQHLNDPFELNRFDCIDLFPRTNKFNI